MATAATPEVERRDELDFADSDETASGRSRRDDGRWQITARC